MAVTTNKFVLELGRPSVRNSSLCMLGGTHWISTQGKQGKLFARKQEFTSKHSKRVLISMWDCLKIGYPQFPWIIVYQCILQYHFHMKIASEGITPLPSPKLGVSWNRGTSGYLQIIHFHRIFHSKPSTCWGYLHLWNPKKSKNPMEIHPSPPFTRVTKALGPRWCARPPRHPRNAEPTLNRNDHLAGGDILVVMWVYTNVINHPWLGDGMGWHL